MFALLLFLASADAKDCKKGQPCGGSCISWSDTCHVGGVSSVPTSPLPAPRFARPPPTEYVVREIAAETVRLEAGDSGLAYSCAVISTACAEPPTVEAWVAMSERLPPPGEGAGAFRFSVDGVRKSCAVKDCVLATVPAPRVSVPVEKPTVDPSFFNQEGE